MIPRMGRKAISDDLKRRIIGYSVAPETPGLIQELGDWLETSDGRVVDEAIRDLHKKTKKRMGQAKD